MVSFPEQPPAGSGSEPAETSTQLPAATAELVPAFSSDFRLSQHGGGGPSYSGERPYLAVPPTRGGANYSWGGATYRGGGVALPATCPLPRGEAGCSGLSRGPESYTGPGPLPSGELTYSFGLEVGPDRVRGVHSGIDLKSKVSRGDLSYGMLRKTLLHAYRLAIHQQSSPAYTN